MAAFNTPWFNQQDRSFFNMLNSGLLADLDPSSIRTDSFPESKVAHLVLAAETEDFDEETMQQWVDEGFDVRYVPFLGGGDDFIKRIHFTGDTFGPSEQYAIVGNTSPIVCLAISWVLIC